MSSVICLQKSGLLSSNSLLLFSSSASSHSFCSERVAGSDGVHDSHLKVPNRDPVLLHVLGDDRSLGDGGAIAVRLNRNKI